MYSGSSSRHFSYLRYLSGSSQRSVSSQQNRPAAVAVHTQWARRGASARMRRASVDRGLGAVPARHGRALAAAPSALAGCRPARVQRKTRLRLDCVGAALPDGGGCGLVWAGVGGLKAHDMPTSHLGIGEGIGGSFGSLYPAVRPAC
jgi:hypothetical protein